jgi:hypothetical protein
MATGFKAAISKFFGRKEGQTLPEFAAELRALTYKDKCEIREMLIKATGEDIEPVAAPAAC